MKTEEADIWEAKNDLPHEEYMDDHGIHYKQLPNHIQQRIIGFDMIYEKALRDGFIDEQEEKNIIHESYEITQLLKKEYGNSHTSKENGGNGVLGFLFGLALGVLGGTAASKNNNT